MGTRNFSSAENYKKWLGYGHATGVFERTPGVQQVKIKGKKKKVKHTKDTTSPIVRAWREKAHGRI